MLEEPQRKVITARSFTEDAVLGLPSPPSDVSDRLAAAKHMAKLGGRAEVVVATREWATKTLNEWGYDWQRNIMPSNVRRLRVEMEAGRFVPFTPIFVCKTKSGRHHLVNGYHTLTAIKETGIPAVLVVIYLYVENIVDVGRVYSTFDIHRARSYVASWKSYKGADPTTIEKKAIAGAPLVMNNFSPSHVESARTDRMEYVKRLLDNGTLDILHGAMSVEDAQRDLVRAMGRAGIMAVLMYIGEHQPSSVAEFIRLTVTESHPSTRHPTRTLARHLRSAQGAGIKFQLDDMKSTASAWNAFCSRRETHHFKINDDSIVFKIAKTPWHKGMPKKDY